jgi:hypothetical protein
MDAITGEAGSYLPLSRSCLSESELRAQEQTKAQRLESSNHGRAPSKPSLPLSLSLNQNQVSLKSKRARLLPPPTTTNPTTPRNQQCGQLWRGGHTDAQQGSSVVGEGGGSPLLSSPLPLKRAVSILSPPPSLSLLSR